MRRLLLLGLAALGLQTVVPHRESDSAVSAGTAVRLELVDLVDAADLVLEARVREARVVEPAPGRIETEYWLDVERTFWGEPVTERLVRLPGGVLPDGRGLVLPGMPSLNSGEDVLLFLSERGHTGVRVPVGLSQGKLEVVTSLSGQRELRREHGSLTTVDASTGVVRDAGTLQILDYAETLAEVHAAAERRLRTGSARGETR